MATKKSPPKKSAKTAKTAVPKSLVGDASRLTWALAITFMVLSLVFVAQAFYYYA